MTFLNYSSGPSPLLGRHAWGLAFLEGCWGSMESEGPSSRGIFAKDWPCRQRDVSSPLWVPLTLTGGTRLEKGSPVTSTSVARATSGLVSLMPLVSAPVGTETAKWGSHTQGLAILQQARPAELSHLEVREPGL